MEDKTPGFLYDSDGNKSSSRLLMITGTLIVLVVWGFVCLQRKEMLDIPWGVLGIVVSLITGKQVNTIFGEKPTR